MDQNFILWKLFFTYSRILDLHPDEILQSITGVYNSPENGFRYFSFVNENIGYAQIDHMVLKKQLMVV